ncbi:MAG: sigma-54 dependent transcriptional regulator [candidate division KSB1 bacterium]|jgi:DNA-binding NtrC family response regulator|nr:sigma-54 dependent transcriptional regulator [candidate division KSB1 bacterium]
MTNKDIRILIVDDEFSVRDSLYQWFHADGYCVDTAENTDAAFEKFKQHTWDIVLLDIKMPGMDGIEFNRHILSVDKNVITIIITAFASVETAVQAIKDGAFDYIAKPIDPEHLTHVVTNALEKRNLAKENIQLRERIEDLTTPDDIIGSSPQLKRVLKMVASVAKTDSTVMIRGESGTGKELIARAIHSNSPRRYAPIISINCGGMTETLLESELFGHEKGAYTGAERMHIGKLERADKGTIFFDEIGNISMKMQMDLLRVLETRQITRLGSDKTIDVDFRVISATNKDLEKAVKSGEFREDLYFRLNVITIDMPALRDRREDIPLLARYFFNEYVQSMAKPITDVSSEAMETLLTYDWPGNIRELRNVIERAIVVCEGDLIEPKHFSFPFRDRDASLDSHDFSLEGAEKSQILRVLKQTDWQISKTAEILKIDRTTLYNKLKKYNLNK